MKRITAIGAVLATTLVSSVAYAETKLTAATWLPPQLQIPTYLYTYWAERVEEYSNGSISIDLQLGSPLTTPAGSLQEIGDGIVDVSGHFAAYTPSDLPFSAAVEELGMIFTDSRAVIAASADFNVNDSRMQAEWAENGVVFGSAWASTPYILFCNEPVTNLEQIKGANLRLPGRAAAEWAASVGAVVVPLSSNEQYGALDTGTLTCTSTIPGDAFSRSLHEVALHATELPITILWAGLGHGYNAQTWEKLTVDERKALLNAEADAMAAMVVEGMIFQVDEARAKMKELGVTFHEPSEDLLASIDAFRDQRLEGAAASVRDNFGISDPEGLLEDFLATVREWEAKLADVPVEDVAAFANLIRTEIYGELDLSSYSLQ